MLDVPLIKSGYYGALARRRPTRASRRGFYLVELSLVLIIIALLIAGVALFYENESRAAKYSDLLSEINLINNIAHQQNDYANISDQEISGEGEIPSKWKLPNGNLTSPFGPITVQPWVSVINGASITVFHMLIYGVPDEACAQLLSSDLGDQEIEVQTYQAGIEPVQGVNENPANAESM